MQKKIACINDISGIGKCSLTVALPIISSLKCQCCPLPTSVLSSQTGYPHYTFVDLTEHIQDYIDTWKKLDQKFDTIYSGFLGSKKQIIQVENLINDNPDAFVVVDPILADLGEMFPIFTDEDVYEMKKLVSKADLITPNITEANLLCGRQIDFFDYDMSSLKDLCKSLAKLGPNYIIITGFTDGDNIYNITYSKNDESFNSIGTKYNKLSFSGTGDIFTSIVASLMTRDFSMVDSVKIATDFIYNAVKYTEHMEFKDRNDGILFEEFLGTLCKL